jgi:hypothetical protein
VKKGELAGWGALVGGVTGYFAQAAYQKAKPTSDGLLSAAGERVLGAAEGAAVGGVLGFLFGGNKR